ncbi:MAG: DUF1566 domain-containing protein [candidate division Zixibacteria bacterium]|nr:DUF1566 domain-containing protein [candidate division Zixibacteria bacterium]
MKKTTMVIVAAVIVALLNAPAQSRTYNIVDTGQDICYDTLEQIECPDPGDSFYGQDAQIDGLQPSYQDNGNGTVTDLVTGLVWIQKPDTDGDGELDSDDQLTWQEFLEYPDTLNAQNYGGYDDWRTPTIKELYSLIDFSGLDPSGPSPQVLVPFIDTDYFDFVYGDTTNGGRLIDAQYWSNTQYVGTVFDGDTAIFGVNFADGRIKGYPRDIGPGGVAVHFARYVRGNTDYGINDFVDNGDGTITDNATGLMWSKDDFGDGQSNGPRSGMTWEEALAWVAQKNDENYLGYDDWRVPNAKEMQSIVDYSRGPDSTNSAAIDPIFNITEITNEAGEVDYPWFWTGTTHARSDGNGSAATYICFGRAPGYMINTWIDVHGAGAQRSDPKGGGFDEYIYIPDGYFRPMSPQGDAIRIYNYVRLVRGGIMCCDVDMTPDDYPIEVPAGGSFGLTGAVSNPTSDAIVTDVWVGVKYQGEFFEQWLFPNILLNSGQFISAHLNQSVPNYAPSGTYEYVAYCGAHPEEICDETSFNFTVMGDVVDGAQDWILQGGFYNHTEAVPTEILLEGNYPNPFNASTSIVFSLSYSDDVTLEVYNLTGQKVATLVDSFLEAGEHSISWDASYYSSGVYFYRLEVGERFYTKRMTLLK